MTEYRKMIFNGIKKRYPDCKVTLEFVKGNNGTSYEGFLIQFADTQCYPVIECERLELPLQNGDCSLEEVLDEIDMILEDRVDLDASFFMDYEKIKDKLYIRLINKSQNVNMLEHAPHRDFLDLAITYRIGPIHAAKAEGNTLVTYPMFQAWGITEDELFEIAYENSFKKSPEIIPMAKLMGQILADTEDEMEFFSGLSSAKDTMYVCGYRSIAGAACMLNKSLFKKFSKEVENDLLILPSSIYELIILPMKEAYSTDAFVQMVDTVNREHVAPNEILSGHIYRYDQKRDEIIDLCA